ncbi:MAG: extracellular solute-binding protein [Longimicrobiales bacterium]
MNNRLPILLAAALLSSACSSDGRTPLIIYSPHGRELLLAFEQRFEQAHPTVDVHWLDLGSQAILDRLRSEKANPQADLWWGAPSALFETGAGEALLEAYSPSWANGLSPEARDDQKMWHGTFLTPMVIAYNSQAVDSARAPRDWDDVLKPEWKDRVIIRDPLESGTMRTIFGMIVYRSLRATGDTAAGFNWLRRLDGQTKEYVLNPTLLYQKLARQDGLITLWDMPDLDELVARTNLPIAYLFPSSGTPVPVDAIALVKNAQHGDLARQFIDFIGQDSEALHAARAFFRLPARVDIPADSLPDRLQRARATILVEPMDWNVVQQRTAEWMRHWDEHVRGRGSESNR